MPTSFTLDHLTHPRGNADLRGPDLLLISAAIGQPLPVDLHDFLLAYSDTHLQACTYPQSAVHAAPTYILGRSDIHPNLFDILIGPPYHEHARVDRDWLPIAIDAATFLFVYRITGAGAGEIWLDRSTRASETTRTYIAGSLAEFCRGLELKSGENIT
ncbi:MAG: hypothetical protein AAGN35_23540 [Bacteroidota bacterium]